MRESTIREKVESGELKDDQTAIIVVLVSILEALEEIAENTKPKAP